MFSSCTLWSFLCTCWSEIILPGDGGSYDTFSKGYFLGARGYNIQLRKLGQRKSTRTKSKARSKARSPTCMSSGQIDLHTFDTEPTHCWKFIQSLPVSGATLEKTVRGDFLFFHSFFSKLSEMLLTQVTLWYAA